MGFIHALMGNTQEAVDVFHRALGLRRDDTFTTTMLGYVMEQLIDEVPPYSGKQIFIFKQSNSTFEFILLNSLTSFIYVMLDERENININY